MARIEWVQQRLENWALWHERGRGGGLGYATSSILLMERVDGGNRDVMLPVDEIEAGETNEGVEALRGPHSDLHRTLELYYLAGVGIKETALAVHRAESTVKAQLARADQVLAEWFAVRKRLKEEAARALRAKLDEMRPAKLLHVTLPEPPPVAGTLKLRRRGFTT